MSISLEDNIKTKSLNLTQVIISNLTSNKLLFQCEFKLSEIMNIEIFNVDGVIFETVSLIKNLYVSELLENKINFSLTKLGEYYIPTASFLIRQNYANKNHYILNFQYFSLSTTNETFIDHQFEISKQNFENILTSLISNGILPNIFKHTSPFLK